MGAGRQPEGVAGLFYARMPLNKKSKKGEYKLEEEELRKLMDDLDDTEVHLGNIQADKETLKKSRIPLNIQVELEEIEIEFSPQIKSLEDEIKTKREFLQAELKKYAKPLKSKYYSWSYAPGKAQWNTDALDGYALDHRDILWMRGEEGKPTTRLTPLKK
jgi:hypothetical protein